MSPGEFTQAFASRLASLAGEGKITVVDDLDLRVELPDVQEGQVYLENAYDHYRTAPDALEELLNLHAKGYLSVARAAEREVDRTRIVPVVKDRAWIDEVRQGLVQRGAETVPEQYYEELAEGLIVLYAVDSDVDIQYLTLERLDEASIAREDLRGLAVANLRRLLTSIERAGEKGLFMFQAGGDYESSLLLFDSIWAGLRAEVQGDVVVAIPTRDCLIASGTKEPEGLSNLKNIAQKIWEEGPYRLTPQPFVFREGKLYPLT